MDVITVDVRGRQRLDALRTAFMQHAPNVTTQYKVRAYNTLMHSPNKCTTILKYILNIEIQHGTYDGIPHMYKCAVIYVNIHYLPKDCGHHNKIYN